MPTTISKEINTPDAKVIVPSTPQDDRVPRANRENYVLLITQNLEPGSGKLTVESFPC
jgi:hypothetical protein